ncbi:MAG: polysaccharide deacetylase family protein [Chitinophagaceae bacterium]|nr:polysaccharide deacetylase family protein [Chitinophagaceae bacterium]MCW5928105.1 polysaccharide deacetylase family protein [Chitinophagaceae bacterium]
MLYMIRSPWILKKIFRSCIWEIPSKEKILYLTFDDGPNPEATAFVLDTLKLYNGKATFFCLGKNVAEHPDMYARILEEGHAVGNHTYNHLNGWKTNDKKYFDDITKASRYIDSGLFRPPYGKISTLQTKYIPKAFGMKVVMWSVLSGDFDAGLTQEKCLDNVLLSSKKGSIIVFHDSAKAYSKLKYVLPRVMEHFGNEGYKFDKINL